ncbi:histidine--tRNA ligase [Sugiyamaella lignohabitans]|uniref:Histidine--tRNA ligase, mitochondrial n=1 Tax=Sugiyamaella lignohabitans TaxID=796027 RepID=A0A161HFB6_9ASCO|nr:histidine--tRNA ligase [Sugiyamaella lignohabitans]ANB11181.1 histidine--tRNA ligase [Sugiyamaella lignohabitans]
MRSFNRINSIRPYFESGLKSSITSASKVLAAYQMSTESTAPVETAVPAKVRAPKAPAAPQFTLKTPKGTKDWADKDMTIRSAIFETITKVFKRHGGVTIDTPVFELREILSGKYGEDSKLIYNLEDQGGELTSLRYDLTVPFARFVAMNGIQNIKRYHIAKVYRRDQPAMTKGRMREFYQCDFDIAGSYENMVADSEILSIAAEGLTALGIEDFTIKVNHRKILDGIFQHCGVKEQDVRKVSSAVDKLDKAPWSEVKKEMVVEKGQPEEVADRIGEYVLIKGTISDVINKLKADSALSSNASAAQGIADMETALPYLEAFGVTKHISFDLSLARGLDYYTGLIYEAVTAASAPPEPSSKEAQSSNANKKSKKAKKLDDDDDNSENVGVGSILAGGRYDNLVGMFAGTSKKNASIPCVGVSFGVERLFSLIKARPGLYDNARSTSTQVFLMAFGGGPTWTGFLNERLSVAKLLWDGGVEAEFMYKTKPKTPKQFEAAEKSGCPFAVILGQEEYPKGIVKVKELGMGSDADQGTDVPLEQLVDFVKAKIAARNNGIDSALQLLRLDN